MKALLLTSCLAPAFLPMLVRADQSNVAEDDASQEAYNGGFERGKNGGSGFAEWKMMTEGDDKDRHPGFFVATTDNNKDLNGIANNGKTRGFYANGSGFEVALAFRALKKSARDRRFVFLPDGKWTDREKIRERRFGWRFDRPNVAHG